jgi:hypothetical protein
LRKFDTGATRDNDTEKYDYEGFLSPQVHERFAAYMHRHRKQADGELRASDNWQKGIPRDAYMKSMYRHFMEVWKAHRNLPAEDLEESLCAMLFNVQGYLFETLNDPYRIVQSNRNVICSGDPSLRHPHVSQPALNQRIPEGVLARTSSVLSTPSTSTSENENAHNGVDCSDTSWGV